jgi:hypothetical protein
VEKKSENNLHWALRRVMLIFEVFRWIGNSKWHTKAPENGSS